MRITRRPSTPGYPSVEDTGAIAPTAGSPPPTRSRDVQGSTGDRVELSDGARLRQRLRSDLGDLEQTDPARVASLRAQVVANTYQSDPRAVAQSVLGELAADFVS